MFLVESRDEELINFFLNEPKPKCNTEKLWTLFAVMMIKSVQKANSIPDKKRTKKQSLMYTNKIL